ncbi:hypothetical protein OAO87_03695 [bacterium]|nr:hypothetical protein [bacterium]
MSALFPLVAAASPLFTATLLSHFIAAPLCLPSFRRLSSLCIITPSLCRSMPFGFSLCGIAPLFAAQLPSCSSLSLSARALRSCEGIDRQCVCVLTCTALC